MKLNKKEIIKTSSNNKKGLIDKNNINSIVFLKLLLKYANKYVNFNISDSTLSKQIKNQIDITLKILSNEEIDHSSINLNNLSPEITKALIILFNNLLSIYSKCKLQNCFNLYRKTILSLKIKERNTLIDEYIDSCYKEIQRGDSILKINLNSNGTKTHYYKLNYERDSIQIFQKDKDSKVDKEIFLYSLIKITFGISSQNLKKKIKLLSNSDQPWLYLSFIFKEGSIDLFLNEEQVKQWFYGLSRHLNIIGKDYKIILKYKFILNRCKMKMANELITYTKKGLIKDSNSNSIIKNLNTNGNNKISFIKLFLLYNKIHK